MANCSAFVCMQVSMVEKKYDTMTSELTVILNAEINCDEECKC